MVLAERVEEANPWVLRDNEREQIHAILLLRGRVKMYLLNIEAKTIQY